MKFIQTLNIKSALISYPENGETNQRGSHFKKEWSEDYKWNLNKAPFVKLS